MIYDIYAAKIDEFQKQIQEIYVSDLKFQINNVYNAVRDIYNLSKEKSSAYRDDFAKLPKRLAKIKTEYSLDTDKLVSQLKQDIENNLLVIDEANSKIAKDYLENQNVVDAEALQTFLAEEKTIQNKLQTEINLLDDNVKRLLDYADESIALEEAAYEARVKAAEQAKKVQENIGKISSASGKNKMIVRDIEDIEKSEKVLNEEPIRVLDFSGDTDTVQNVSQKIKKQEEKSLSSDSGLIKKSSGTISKASGVIVKKN